MSQKAIWLQAWYGTKSSAFHHNGSSNAHAKLWKVKINYLQLSFMQNLKGDKRHIHISSSSALLNEISSSICHMVSNRANTWQFKLCPQPFLYSLFSSPAHTEAFYSGSQRGQTGKTFFSLEEKDVAFCLSLFFYTGQDYFIHWVPSSPTSPTPFFSCFVW